MEISWILVRNEECIQISKAMHTLFILCVQIFSSAKQEFPFPA